MAALSTILTPAITNLSGTGTANECSLIGFQMPRPPGAVAPPAAAPFLRARTTTAANTIAPTTNSVVGLTVKGTTGTAAHVLDIYNSNATPTLQSYFDANGALNTAQTLTVSAGGLAITGNSTIAGTLGSLTGITLASGNITGAGTVDGATLSSTAINGVTTANITTPGNTFNGTSQLVQTTAGGLLPVISGANLH